MENQVLSESARMRDLALSIGEMIHSGRVTLADASTATGVAQRLIIEVSWGNTDGFTLYELEKMVEKIAGIAIW